MRVDGTSEVISTMAGSSAVVEATACRLVYLNHLYAQLNLFLAVLKTKFAKAKNLLDEKRRHRRAMMARRGSKKRNVLARATGWMKSECLRDGQASMCALMLCLELIFDTTQARAVWLPGLLHTGGVAAHRCCLRPKPMCMSLMLLLPLLLLLQRVSRPMSHPRPATTR